MPTLSTGFVNSVGIRAARHVGELLADVATIAADEVDGVGLDHVQAGAIEDAGADAAGHGRHERHGDGLLAALRTDLQRDVLDLVLEAEAEREVFASVAVVVDVDVVDGVGIEREVVRSAVRVLERQVVRDQRDVTRTSRLVAAEHIEVGAVDLRMLGDERRFAMARRRCDERHGERRGGREQPAGLRLAMHGVSPVMFVAGHDVPFADTRERAIRMQNASKITHFARANTQGEKSNTHETAFWMQRSSKQLVACGVRA